MHVLAITASPEIKEELTTCFAGSDAELLVAGSVTEGIALCRLYHPDIVMLELPHTASSDVARRFTSWMRIVTVYVIRNRAQWRRALWLVLSHRKADCIAV